MTAIAILSVIFAGSSLILAYSPPKKDSVVASLYTGGYGNVPAAVDFGLSSAAPKVQVTYGSINKVHAEVKQKRYTAASSYGAMPEQGNVIQEEKQVKQPPSLSYAGYRPNNEAEVKQPKSSVQVSVKTETPKKEEVPKLPYGGSYAGNADVESHITEKVLTKRLVTQLPITPKKPVVPYGSIYGGVETKDQNVKETKIKVQPPPMTNYGSYGSVGNKVEENVKQRPTTLPPPPPPASSNYGSIVTGYGQPVKEVSATTQFVSETRLTGKPFTIPTSYDAFVQPKKDSVIAKVPSGYGVVPESAGSSTGTKKISAPLQPLPSSYGSLVQWKKDQVPKDDVVKRQSKERIDESRNQSHNEKDVDQSNKQSVGGHSEEVSPSSLASSIVLTITNPQPSAGSAEENNEIRDQTASPSPPMPECMDKNGYCDYWKEKNECEQNPAYMRVNCPVACGTCHYQRKYLMMQELQNSEI